MNIRGGKAIKEGQLVLRALDLREEVLDTQFTGELKQSLIQQGPQEWFI